MSRRASRPYFYLRDDEEVLLRLRPGAGYGVLVFAVGAVAATLLAAALALFLRVAQTPSPPAAPAAVHAALVVLAGLFAWRRWATTEYALTDARIYARTGRMVTRVHFTTHDKVTDVRYRQGPLDRLAGVARIVFMTAGGDVAVVGVPDALAVKERAESARDAFIERLLRAAEIEPGRVSAPPVATAAWPAPETPAAPALSREAWTGPRPDYLKQGDEPVWYGKPRLAASVAPLRGVVFPVLVVAFALAPALARQGLAWLTPAALAAAIAGPLAWRAVQLRHTEYVVTDRRVYARSGVLGTTVSQLTYDKITDITYRQDVFGRLLGFGGLVVNTAGSNAAPIQMVGLSEPLAVKERLERERTGYLREEGA